VRDGGDRIHVGVTAAIVVLPLVGLGRAGWLLWGRLIHPVDLVLTAVLYTITGLGVAVGFHRGLTHGSYRALRPVRIALAVAGSMSFQGDVIGWVATHRRRHPPDGARRLGPRRALADRGPGRRPPGLTSATTRAVEPGWPWCRSRPR
jgi:hypothetical protein